MATLTVLTYGNADAADAAVATLETLAEQKLFTIYDAATVSWQRGPGNPKSRQLHHLTGPGAVGGVFWGMLFGLIFFVPLLGAAIGAATGALAGSLGDVGIDDDFVKSVREQITPGTSALFLMSSGPVPDKARAAFDTGPDRPRVIQCNLSPEQESALREMISA